MKQKWFPVLSCMFAMLLLLSACGEKTTPADPTQITGPTVDDIAGDWSGTMINSDTGETLVELNIRIQPGCEIDKICGSYTIPAIPCGGDFVYTGMNGKAFQFTQQLTEGDIDFCGTGSFNEIMLLDDGTLSQTWTDGTNHTHATLTKK